MKLTIPKKALFGAFATFVVYLLFEVLVYFLCCSSVLSPQSPNHGYFNHPCAGFDSTTGYRWIPGDWRIARIISDKVSFDQVFHVNRQGYISPYDYEKKKSLDSRRFMVFGDSFTAAEFLETPWPVRLQELLAGASLPENTKYEIYSYGVDGGGLYNWHEIFFKEIVPNYDFDGLIIASFVDNLRRDFTIFHMTEEGGYIDRFREEPRSDLEFHNKYLPMMPKLWEVVPDEVMDENIRSLGEAEGWQWLPFRLYATQVLLPDLYKTIKRRIAQKHRRAAKAQDASDLVAQDSETEVLTDAGLHILNSLGPKYGRRRIARLAKILDYCKSRQIRVILSPIPGRSEITELGKSTVVSEHQAELKAVADAYGFEYFDGYSIFADRLPADLLDEYWLHLDGHWNQSGSDIYAKEIMKCIIQEQVRPESLN